MSQSQCHCCPGRRAGLVMLVGFLLAPMLAQAESSASLATAMPKGAVAFVEISDLGEVVQRLRMSEAYDLVVSSSQWRHFEQTDQYRKIQAGKQVVENQLGIDLWQAISDLLGNRVAVAVYPVPDRKWPDVVAIVRVAKPQTLAQVQERVEPMLVLAGNGLHIDEMGDGAKMYSLGRKAFVATGRDWIAVSGAKQKLQKTVQLLAGKAQDSLASDRGLASLLGQTDSRDLLRAGIDTKAITGVLGGRLGPKKLDNPLTSLLFGGVFELGMQCDGVRAAVQAGEQSATLNISLACKPSKLGQAYAPFFGDPKIAGTRGIPRPAGTLAGLTIYRDVANWYRQREQLLEGKGLPRFDQFESGVNNILPGKSFAEDVLSLLGKQFTIVVGKQDYGYLDGEPRVKLPAFALIVELAKPQEGADLFQLVFQTLMSILNLQAGQRGGLPWIMTLEQYQDVPVTYAKYLQKPTGKQLPITFNFSPASACVGNQFIVSSSVSLCRGLIDEYKKGTQSNGKRPSSNFELAVYPGEIADVLQANSQLLRARIVRAGRSPEQAKADFANILKGLRHVDGVTLRNEVRPETFDIHLQVTWR